MADNGSANRAANRRYREAQHANRPFVDGDNGTRTPPSPFTAQGRSFGKSAEELRRQGMDAYGHPLPSQFTNGQVNEGSRSARPGGTRGQGIAQLAQSIGDMDLCNQNDIHAFCESIRKVLNYFAISVELAKGQLRAAARAQAKENADGRLTIQQKLELAKALNSLGRDLNAVSRSCISGAASSVKAWRRFDGFLGELDANASRPGKGRGPFGLV